MNGKINGIYFNVICHDFGYTFSDTFPHLYPDRLMLRENMIPGINYLTISIEMLFFLMFDLFFLSDDIYLCDSRF